MASFTEDLNTFMTPAATPSPTFGSIRRNPINSIMNAVRPFALEARNFRLADQARMNDLSIRPDRARSVFGEPQQAMSQMNTVYNPGMSDYQRASINLDREKLLRGEASDRNKLSQDKQLTERKLGIDEKRLELDTEKNANIYETKLKELEQKATNAENQLEIARGRLEKSRDDATALANFRQATLEAQAARHAAELARRDLDIENRTKLNDARIKQIQDAIDNAGYSMTETVVDDTGQKRVVITKKGSEARPTTPVVMIGKDGKPYNIAPDMVEQAIKDGFKRK